MGQMIEVKVADLIGPALDWAVARAHGLDVRIEPSFYGTGPRVFVYGGLEMTRYRPSAEWRQGGHMIERLMKTGRWEIVQGSRDGDVWVQNYNAECLPVDGESYDQESRNFQSDSLLVACCRAIAWEALGDGVLVPAELVTP